MTKRVVLNETIISKMKSVLGEDISPDNYVVYKARAISTEAISKRGSDLLNGATPTENFIRSIVAMANEPQKNVSVHMMHDDRSLPIGRVFDMWEVVEFDSVHAAYAYLAILKNDENKGVIEKIDGGILDEVSIGFEIKSGKCSVCGWDFYDNDLGEEDKFEHLWNATCANGHVMGKDGAHLVLDAPKSFSEISIVNQGAAHKAKIQEIAKFSLSFEDAKKDAKSLLAKVGNTTVLTKLESKMTEEEMTAKFAEMEAKLADMSAKLSSSEDPAPAAAEPAPEGKKPDEAPADEGDKKPSEAPADEGDKPAEATAEAAHADKEEDKHEDEKVKALEAEVEKLKAEKEGLASELATAKATFAEEVNKALVAADKEKVSAETELSAMAKALHDANVTLAAIPVNGRAAAAAKADDEEAPTFYGMKINQLNAFK